MATSAGQTQRFLKDELQSLPKGLAAVLEAISRAAVDIAVRPLLEFRGFRTAELGVMSADYTGQPNQFGDSQLMADVRTDEIIHNRLIESGCVETAPSEEYPTARKAAGTGYSVAFDPLDGSSIFKSNLAVGTILGIWKGATPVGQTGRDLASAAYAVYGPKTLLVIARPVSGTTFAFGCLGMIMPLEDDAKVKVQEFVYVNSSWCLTKDDIQIGEENICAPANFRAATDSEVYQTLMQGWMKQNYILRYSGAMGGGIYCFPSSKLSPTRLRLMYECAPMAFIVEAAGGASYNDEGASLDQRIESYDDKCTVFIGSKSLAAECHSRFKAA